MNTCTENKQAQELSPNEELDEMLFYNPLSLDLVSALAGDRELLESEKVTLETMKKGRGAKFYSDLLFAITHRFFSPFAAQVMWEKILCHKYDMSVVMNRNIRIAVASLDYLSNLTAELHSATLTDESYIADLIRLSVHDGLTGLLNHSCCFQKIDAELKRFVRYKTDVSLMMIDIDNFKAVNDTYGHLIGDNVLAALGVIIREEAREADFCCRYGGEEFAVIMPLTDANSAGTLAERLRARIAQTLFDGRTITVSIGVASCSEDIRTPQALVEKADAALYDAKKAGKNLVVVDKPTA
jgi:diguanylate cyclase (GGDEF)-like protein